MGRGPDTQLGHGNDNGPVDTRGRCLCLARRPAILGGSGRLGSDEASLKLDVGRCETKEHRADLGHTRNREKVSRSSHPWHETDDRHGTLH